MAKFLDLSTIPVEKTNDASIFKYVEENRKIDKKNVDKIIYNLDKTFFQAPILVFGNDKVVIDGQHRLEAIKKINEKLPDDEKENIFYIQIPEQELPKELHEVIIGLNSASKLWSNKLILDFKEKRQEDNVVFIRELSREYNWPENMIYSILCGEYKEACTLRDDATNFTIEEKTEYADKVSVFNSKFTKMAAFLPDDKTHVKKGFLQFYLDKGMSLNYEEMSKLEKTLSFIHNTKKQGLPNFVLISNDGVKFEWPSMTSYGKWKELFKSILDDTFLTVWKVEDPFAEK